MKRNWLVQQARPNEYPDYHFLLISPNLGAEWLFDAARSYWDRFRPTIINDFNFMILIPPETTIAVTVIARRDTASEFGVQLAQRRPNAYFDPVVYDLFDDTKRALDERVSASEPFGVPLSAPLPSDIPPFIPTPRPTGAAAGATSEASGGTPAPTAAPPTADPESSEEAPNPILPTPGSILGG
jgi:hypothetical protein